MPDQGVALLFSSSPERLFLEPCPPAGTLAGHPGNILTSSFLRTDFASCPHTLSSPSSWCCPGTTEKVEGPVCLKTPSPCFPSQLGRHCPAAPSVAVTRPVRVPPCVWHATCPASPRHVRSSSRPSCLKFPDGVALRAGCFFFPVR